MDYEKAQELIVRKLSNELKPEITYHNFDHTKDVLNSVELLGEMEKINGHEMILLKTAALYHDSGMLITYEGHEEASTRLTVEYLPQFGYGKEEIQTINKMILATRLPQHAGTYLEKILCDADLDYLGRSDFFMIALRLQYEWNTLKIHRTTIREWYELQLIFLKEHTYFTRSAQVLRNGKKQDNIRELEMLLS